MKRSIAAWALAGSTLLGAAMSHAAGADLAVEGKLQSGACNVALANGGVVNVGRIKSSDLEFDKFTSLGIFGPLSVSIDCKLPSRIAMRLLDNRAGTHLGSQFNGPTVVYGLGLSGGRKIGEYVVISNEVHGDGDAVRTLARMPGGADEPAAFKTIGAHLVAFVGINKGSELDLSQDIVTDGSATMELVYL